MDIVPSDIGQITAIDGELPVSSDRGTLLKTYMRAALLSALQDADFNINRLSTATTNRETLELQAKRIIIDYINGSAFASDFDETKFSITLVGPDGNGDVSFKIDYSPGEDSLVEQINDTFTITGGALNLSEPDVTYPSVDEDESEFITEEHMVDAITDRLILSVPANYPVMVLKPGQRVESVRLTGSANDIPVGERRVYALGQGDTGDDAAIQIGAKDPFGTADSGIDSLFVADLDKDGVLNGRTILYVNDIKGNLRDVQFIEAVEQYAIFIDDADPFYEIEVGFGDPLSIGQETVSLESLSRDDIMDPFPAGGKHGPHITFLDRPLDEGLYTLVYRARARNDYNGSMWRQ